MEFEFDSDKFADSAKERIKNTVKDISDNAESITLLSLSGIGLTSLLSKIPFLIKIPSFLNPVTVIPVLSVTIIGGLATSAIKRQMKRRNKNEQCRPFTPAG